MPVGFLDAVEESEVALLRCAEAALAGLQEGLGFRPPAPAGRMGVLERCGRRAAGQREMGAWRQAKEGGWD